MGVSPAKPLVRLCWAGGEGESQDSATRPGGRGLRSEMGIWPPLLQGLPPLLTQGQLGAWGGGRHSL